MRIIHILNYTRQGNGMVCAALDLACTQVKMGHEVYVCSGGGDFDALFAQHGVKTLMINQDRKVKNILSALRGIARMIREIKPDIIHAHMMTSAVLVAMLRPFLKFKLVTTVHNEFQRSALLMGVGHKVIAVSDAVRDSMIKRGIPARKIETVLNGTINSPRFPKPNPEPFAMRQTSILFVGGLHERKGVVDLIKAFAIVLTNVPQANLYIVGGGPSHKEYEELGKRICGPQLVFCGFQPDPRPYLLAADIFVLPSHAEPASLVISEAREFGCAVVVSDVGGNPQMVDYGDAGVIVPAKNPEKLAEAFIKLLTDVDYLEEMKHRSQNNIAYFTIDRVAADTEKLYRELIA